MSSTWTDSRGGRHDIDTMPPQYARNILAKEEAEPGYLADRMPNYISRDLWSLRDALESRASEGDSQPGAAAGSADGQSHAADTWTPQIGDSVDVVGVGASGRPTVYFGGTTVIGVHQDGRVWTEWDPEPFGIFDGLLRNGGHRLLPAGTMAAGARVQDRIRLLQALLRDVDSEGMTPQVAERLAKAGVALSPRRTVNV